MLLGALYVFGATGGDAQESSVLAPVSADLSELSLCAREPALLDGVPNASSALVDLLGVSGATTGMWRYFTVFPCGQSAVCLSFMSTPWEEDWVATLVSHDDGRSFGGAGEVPALLLPAHWQPSENRIDWMTSNLAIMPASDGSGRYTIFGGLSQVHASAQGVTIAHADTYRFSGADEVPLPKGDAAVNGTGAWRGVRLLFNGSHPGCVEGRRDIDKLVVLSPDGALACEFDGRLSAVEHEGRTFVYARSNPAQSGNRTVQVVAVHSPREARSKVGRHASETPFGVQRGRLPILR